MKTIKLFIASSSEMKTERLEIIDLLVDLNDEYEDSGIKFEPVVWEFMDSSMRETRKEDDYLIEMVKCQICIVMFWRTLGEYTLEEFEVAIKEMKANRNIKAIYLLFKEPCEGISNELSEFKRTCEIYYQDISFRFNGISILQKHISDLLKYDFKQLT